MYNLCPSAVFLQGATDEFVLDLVEQCTFQKQRMMHLVMTSRYGSGFMTVALAWCWNICAHLSPRLLLVAVCYSHTDVLCRH